LIIKESETFCLSQSRYNYPQAPHMRRMDLSHELSGLDADNAKTPGEDRLKRSVGE